MMKTICRTVALLALPLTAYATEFRIEERPRQECWIEQVPVSSARSGNGNAIVGSIAGGLLGSQIGGGAGRAAATAAGAIAGTIIGNRISADSAPYQSYQTIQRCQTVIDTVRVPVPEYYEPVPLVEQRIYYVEQPADWRREQWRREQWRREQWRHEQWRNEYWQRKHWKHHRDDDDERGRDRHRRDDD